MSEYSGFKIKRPHSLTPLTSVYEAVAVDGRAGRFALKIFHPPASTNVRRVYAIEGWLLAAERQKQSAQKDGSVLEVLACGRCEEGAFAVLPWQERFLEPWIKTLQPKGDTLRALATCLLNTIEAWEKETGGPHGNLKPANIFLDRSGSLVGMTAKLSDPAFTPGASIAALRLADLNAVGTMLAQIVRRRPPGAWPIEDAPEWKALGGAGKGWLDYCNYLLNPQQGEGEVTLANARLRLKKVPKDANPVKTAALTLAALLVLGAIGVVGFARFGNYIYMPDQIQRLARILDNPTVPKVVPPAWARLCVAWDTWLVDMQSNGNRLLQTDGLLEANEPLRIALAEFVRDPNRLRPEILIPEAASEKRLGVLGTNPPAAVFNELLITSKVKLIQDAEGIIGKLAAALENWQHWEQLRALQKLMADNKYSQVADALALRLPPARGTAEYGRLNVVRTLKFFNDLSLDNTGTLPLASRWSEISHLKDDMLASGDQIQKAMPRVILGRLVDKSSLSDFADSLVSPLEEMQQRRKEFLDPQVVRERYLKQSRLQQMDPANVTAEDFPKWENELKEFTLVPKTVADDPRLAPELDDNKKKMSDEAVELEAEAPESEPGQKPMLSSTDFKREDDGLTANLKSLRDRQIVKRDLPEIRVETGTVADAIQTLYDRVKATLILLKPETWLAKARQPYGMYNETKQRWSAWQAVDVPASVTADSLRGQPNRAKFKKLRENKQQIKEWIDGVEGKDGFGALDAEKKVQDLAGNSSSDTVKELQRLEGVLRERAVTAVAMVAGWSNALPQTKWGPATTTDPKAKAMRDPLEQHSLWLGQLRDFAINLDELSKLLANGFEWEKGVHETVILLATHKGVDELKGKPAEWYAEAKQLEQLEAAPIERGVLIAAANAVGLSRKLTAWRRLDKLADWPTGAADFDLDLGVVAAMRLIVRRDIKDEARKNFLLKEMGEETRLRFNRAARTASRAENQLNDMYNKERMQRANISEADLDDPVKYNYALWQLKTADRNVKSLDVLGKRRDAFVASVNAINSIKEQSGVAKFVKDLSELELKDDPSKSRSTTSPANFGWQEEYTNEGLGLTATWKNGARTVKLDYSIVQPPDDSGILPFYLALRTISVGEFLELMNGRPKDVEAVKEMLPDWAKKPGAPKPYDVPLAWYPRDGSQCKVFELSPAWIFAATSLVGGLLKNTELYATVPQLKQAVVEAPTLKSPLQQVTPDAAKAFAEKMLGARLPTVKEWQAVLQVTGVTAASGHFRGPSFQKLFDYLKHYEVPGVKGSTLDFRPSTGVFLPGRDFKDDGQANAKSEENRLWFYDVDEGPKSGDFVNLTGNVSLFLTGETPTDYYVAGGSILSPPGIDFLQPQKIVAGGSLIGGSASKTAYSDVGIRPASDAPYGFRQRSKLINLVKVQKYLTL